MKVYHYSGLNDWHHIKSGSWKSSGKPGISASKRLAPEVELGWKTGCSFHLFEPAPENWIDSVRHPYAWQALMANTGNLLLEVDIKRHFGHTFVVDWGHREEVLQADLGGMPRNKQYELGLAATEAYVNSMISIKDYLKNRDVLNYDLPEIIVTKVVPLSDVRISDEQPKLDDRITRWAEGSGLYNSLRGEISRVPELRGWAEEKGDIGLQEACRIQDELCARWGGKER